MFGGYSGLLQGVVLASNVLWAEWNNQDEHNPCCASMRLPSSRDRLDGMCEFAYETRSGGRITVFGTGP